MSVPHSSVPYSSVLDIPDINDPTGRRDNNDKSDWTVNAMNGTHLWTSTEESGCSYATQDCTVMIRYFISTIFKPFVNKLSRTLCNKCGIERYYEGGGIQQVP